MSVISDALKKAQKEREKKETISVKAKDSYADMPSIIKTEPKKRKVHLKEKYKTQIIDFLFKPVGLFFLLFIIFYVSFRAYVLYKLRPKVQSKNTSSKVSKPNLSYGVDDKNEATATSISSNNTISAPIKEDRRMISFTNTTDAIPSLVLNGIVYDPNKPYVIVNNRAISVGDSVKGAILIAINKKSATFVYNNKKFQIYLED